MPEDITAQILNQTAESIQKLYDLSTRIDERVKAIQINQKELENSLDAVQRTHSEIMQKIAVLESKDIGVIHKEIKEIETRLTLVEMSEDQSKDRWNKMFTFVIQIIWVILAAWLLMKLGLQAPAVP